MNVMNRMCKVYKLTFKILKLNGKNMLVNITDSIISQNGVLKLKTWTL
jgi:hypothetical protein